MAIDSNYKGREVIDVSHFKSRPRFEPKTSPIRAIGSKTQEYHATHVSQASHVTKVASKWLVTQALRHRKVTSYEPF